MGISAADARKALLQVLQAGDGEFSRKGVIKDAAARLGQWGDQQGGRLLMEAWDDLYRAGAISWGMDMANLDPPWAHLTAYGREIVKDLDRDPANPSSYLAQLAPLLSDPIAISYVAEAVDTYNRACVKAAAVMLGCAAEALNLSLRDQVKNKILANGGTPPAALDDWRIAAVLRALEHQLSQRVGAMPRDLREAFESYWPAWSGLFRMTRNSAGHPKSVDPVTRDAVHAALLLFPQQARLTSELSAWVTASF